jgi:hypothetical protein
MVISNIRKHKHVTPSVILHHRPYHNKTVYNTEDKIIIVSANYLQHAGQY